ncbi:MAG: hypothetical protein ABUL67_03910 [Haliangium ochraceum]
MTKRVAWVVAGLVLAGCSGSSLNDGQGGAVNLVGVQCGWPEGLNDGGAGACQPSRTYVTCKDPAGDGCLCSSDGVRSCDCSGFLNAGPWTCSYSCAANQYALNCSTTPRRNDAGDIQPAGPIDPPAGCVSASVTPGGISYCCPCQ